MPPAERLAMFIQRAKMHYSVKLDFSKYGHLFCLQYMCCYRNCSNYRSQEKKELNKRLNNLYN